jgi:HEAT repeat protein
MARNDPDASVRDIAIDSLGILAVQESLPLLKQIVENSQEDPDLRKIAYLSILRTLDRPLAEIQTVRQRDFDPGLVDWNLLLAISNADEQS